MCRQLGWSPAVRAHKPCCLGETCQVSHRAGRGTRGGRPRHRKKPAPQHRLASVPRYPGSGWPPSWPQRSDPTDVRALRIQGTGPKSLAAPQDVLTQSHCAGCPGRQLPLESTEDSPGRQSSSLEPDQRPSPGSSSTPCFSCVLLCRGARWTRLRTRRQEEQETDVSTAQTVPSGEPSLAANHPP